MNGRAQLRFEHKRAALEISPLNARIRVREEFVHPLIIARNTVAELLPDIARLKPGGFIGRFSKEFSGNAVKVNVRRVREQTGRKARNINNALCRPWGIFNFLHEIFEVLEVEHIDIAAGNKPVHLLPVGALQIRACFAAPIGSKVDCARDDDAPAAPGRIRNVLPFVVYRHVFIANVQAFRHGRIAEHVAIVDGAYVAAVLVV